MTSNTNGNYVNGFRQNQVPSITKITVRGIKSLADESSIDILPLTILAGANSSGKSSIMQPLLLLKQTIEASYNPGALLLNGPNIRITSVDQLLTKQEKNSDTIGFLIEISLAKGAKLSTEFKKNKSQVGGVEVSRQTYLSADGKSQMLSADLTVQEMHDVADSLPEMKKRLDDSGLLSIGTDRCFLTLIATYMEENVMNLAVMKMRELDPSIPVAIYSTLHVPGLRGTRERAYPVTGTGPQFPGTFDFYTASVLFSWQISQPEKMLQINQYLSDLGLAMKVQVLKLDDTQLEIQVSRTLSEGSTDNEMINIADVGIGVSQVLPVLVGSLLAEPGQVVYIEQPEIHLHPRAQTALAQILVDSANRGVRVVVETHSSLLLLAIQTLVAEGELATDKAILHWFERDENGVTQINSSGLDEAGAYGEWPVDFDNVSLTLQSRYLDAAESHYLSQS